MQKKKITLLVSTLLILAISACNLPGGNPELSGLELTVTAQAQLLEQATATPEFTATPGSTSTPGATATPEFTATSSIPTITVSVDTNCRLGPGLAYASVSILVVGKSAQVVGKNSSAPNYWVINNPTGSGTCWLWGEYATITGDTSGLQEYAVPPTPTPTITLTPTLASPKPAKDLSVAKICIPQVFPTFGFTGNLTWKDQSDNEDGFNIYIMGGAPVVVPANTTSFPIPQLPLAAGTPYTLGVESFNAAGKGTLKEISFTCP